jgi:hypothetical protein
MAISFFYFKLNEASKEKENGTRCDHDAGLSFIQRENPNKYLLYKPSFSQFYTYTSAAFKDLMPHAIMMIYISADNYESFSKNQIESNL